MDARLEIGHGGVFEVRVHDRVVAARKTWSFPGDEEIVAAVARALGR